MSLPKLTGIETEYGILIQGAQSSDPFFASELLLHHCEEARPFRNQPEQASPSPVIPEPEPSRSLTRPLLNWSRLGRLLGLRGGLKSVLKRRSSADQTAQAAGSTTKEPEVDSRWDAGEELVDYSFDGRLSGQTSFMLPNGSRYYIDHAHPEYCTAEASDPRVIVAADKAGECIVRRCQERANESGILPAGQSVRVYKNNSDQKDNSYGCHENYLLETKAFNELIYRKLHRTLMHLVPFLVTRPILCGAGKVGAENSKPAAGFQLSQRADFMDSLIGLQTTYNRPLINTRDEAHAGRSRFRRLHVIVGDANMAEYSTFLKVGTTQLVLMMLEDSYLESDFTLTDPLGALQTVSRDLTFSEKLSFHNGSRSTAVAIQRAYLERAEGYLATRASSPALQEVVDVWRDALGKLETDWRLLCKRLDWAVKRNLLERYIDRVGSDWESLSRWSHVVSSTVEISPSPSAHQQVNCLDLIRAQLPDRADALERYARSEQLDWQDYWQQRQIHFMVRKLDLTYHDISRQPDDCGLFYRLQEQGEVEQLTRDEEVGRLVESPPVDNRAYLRGYCLRHYAPFVARADWSEIDFRLPKKRALRKLRLDDPTWGTAAQVDQLAGSTSDLSSFLDAIEESRCTISRKGVVHD